MNKSNSIDEIKIDEITNRIINIKNDIDKYYSNFGKLVSKFYNEQPINISKLKNQVSKTELKFKNKSDEILKNAKSDVESFLKLYETSQEILPDFLVEFEVLMDFWKQIDVDIKTISEKNNVQIAQKNELIKKNTELKSTVLWMTNMEERLNNQINILKSEKNNLIKSFKNLNEENKKVEGEQSALKENLRVLKETRDIDKVEVSNLERELQEQSEYKAKSKSEIKIIRKSLRLAQKVKERTRTTRMEIVANVAIWLMLVSTTILFVYVFKDIRTNIDYMGDGVVEFSVTGLALIAYVITIICLFVVPMSRKKTFYKSAEHLAIYYLSICMFIFFGMFWTPTQDNEIASIWQTFLYSFHSSFDDIHDFKSLVVGFIDWVSEFYLYDVYGFVFIAWMLWLISILMLALIGSTRKYLVNDAQHVELISIDTLSNNNKTIESKPPSLSKTSESLKTDEFSENDVHIDDDVKV